MNPGKVVVEEEGAIPAWQRTPASWWVPLGSLEKFLAWSWTSYNHM